MSEVKKFKINGVPVDIKDATAREAAAAKYTKPGSGIPKTDLESAVQTSLGKADSAYQKASAGIPKSDLANGVQNSLGAADTAYQKPSAGVPKNDLDSSVQSSLDKADTALQEHQSLAGYSEAGEVTGTVEDEEPDE